MPGPMSASTVQTCRHKSAAGRAAAVHQTGPLLQPLTTEALSIHTVRGGIASCNIFSSPHSSARSDVGYASEHDPYNPCWIAPCSSTRIAAHPARRALAGGPPLTAPSVNPIPVNVKSPIGGLPPHHLATALGTACSLIFAGIPCLNNGSLQCAALCAFRMMAWSANASRLSFEALHMQKRWCKLPTGRY